MSNNIEIKNGTVISVTVPEQSPSNVTIAGTKSVGKSDAHYVHNQTVSTNTWNITHNLDKYPSVSVVDSSDRVVIGQIDYVNNNSLIITFKSAFKGKAYLN